MLSAEEIADLLKKKIWGLIPENDGIAYAAAIGRALYGGAAVKDCFSILADNVHNGRNKIYDCVKGYRGFFGAIKRSLKRRV
jgi:septum formation inhibitor-activating ATPase MinD